MRLQTNTSLPLLVFTENRVYEVTVQETGRKEMVQGREIVIRILGHILFLFPTEW